MNLPIFTALLALSLLSACSDMRSAERLGISLELVQLSDTFELSIEDGAEAESRLDRFVELNWPMIATQPVELRWHKPRAEQFALQYAKKLSRAGIDYRKVSVLQGDASSAFDISLTIVRYDVIGQPCDDISIGHYGRNSLGCAIANMRWKSMVNPEKMLSATDVERPVDEDS